MTDGRLFVLDRHTDKYPLSGPHRCAGTLPLCNFWTEIYRPRRFLQARFWITSGWPTPSPRTRQTAHGLARSCEILLDAISMLNGGAGPGENVPYCCYRDFQGSVYPMNGVAI
jgi:hypothetical protein